MREEGRREVRCMGEENGERWLKGGAMGEKLQAIYMYIYKQSPSPLASLMQTTLRTYAVNLNISWSNLSPARKRLLIRPVQATYIMYSNVRCTHT